MNALLYLAEGDYANAALSAAAMIPIVGSGATAARMCAKYCDNVVKSVSGVARRVGPDNLRKACRLANSFVVGTLVLMADGSFVPIEEVTVGDVVLASDPVTGVSGPRRVTATISGDGVKHLVDVTVEGSDDVVTATDGHPFWVTKRGWVDAGMLAIGDQLVDDSGVTRRVGAVKAWTSLNHQVHNLTVEGVHTYHVGQDSTLVHNCGTGMLDSARALRDAGVDRAGRRALLEGAIDFGGKNVESHLRKHAQAIRSAAKDHDELVLGPLKNSKGEFKGYLADVVRRPSYTSVAPLNGIPHIGSVRGDLVVVRNLSGGWVTALSASGGGMATRFVR